MQLLVADDGKSACHALTEVGRPGGYAETPVCGTLLRGQERGYPLRGMVEVAYVRP